MSDQYQYLSQDQIFVTEPYTGPAFNAHANSTNPIVRSEGLDPRFVVVDKPSRFFNLGRVFKTLWVEPGGTATRDTDKAAYHEVGYGQYSYAKVRRFVVIQKRLHCSVCLAISSYGGQGVAKDDVRSRDHAIVYPSHGVQPLPSIEEKIVISAFPIVVEEPGESITEMSRLDFGKIYTVEHNVKVQNVGRISPEHLDRLNQSFQDSMTTPRTIPEESNHIDQYRSQDIPSNRDFVLPSYKTPSEKHIIGTGGESQELDRSYKVRNLDYKKFFRPGRVFSTLWSEPYECSTKEFENSRSSSSLSFVLFNQKVQTKIRRFVVVRQSDRSCICIPITTYNGKGHRKKGIDLAEHGAVYSSGRPPKSVKGINKKPLKVNLSKGVETLLDGSYINYGRVYTIETNVKVKDIGELDSDSRRLLREYYNEVQLITDPDLTARTRQDRSASSDSNGDTEQNQHEPFSGPLLPSAYYQGHGTLQSHYHSQETSGINSSGYSPHLYSFSSVPSLTPESDLRATQSSTFSMPRTSNLESRMGQFTVSDVVTSTAAPSHNSPFEEQTLILQTPTQADNSARLLPYTHDNSERSPAPSPYNMFNPTSPAGPTYSSSMTSFGNESHSKYGRSSSTYESGDVGHPFIGDARRPQTSRREVDADEINGGDGYIKRYGGRDWISRNDWE